VNARTKKHCLLLLGYTLTAAAIIVTGLLRVGTKTVTPEMSEQQHMS
jgi:hypothetical protein